MPVKKTKKPRARKAPAKKKGLKQKQKQQQKVNVQVSTGGGGGGTQFIPMPMPSAPAFDYAQLANLIRPANTVDIPIRAQANPEPLPAKEAEAPSLAEEMSSAKAGKGRKVPIHQKMTEREAGYETFPSSESEREVRNILRKKEGQSASMFRKFGSSGAFDYDPDEPIRFPSSRSGSGQTVQAPTRDLFGSGPTFSSSGSGSD